MMGQPKPFAALSSGLLARKGQAKPAMRPQGYSGFGAVSDAIDDLGWNDMGHNDSQPGSPPPTAVTLPPVLRERQVLSEELQVAAGPVPTAPVAPPPVPVATAVTAPPAIETGNTPSSPRRSTRSGSDRGMKSKSAFTLRLDGERHLRLRLASVLRHQSAQQLVTEALDSFLKTLPEVEVMANRLSAGAGNDLDNGG